MFKPSHSFGSKVRDARKGLTDRYIDSFVGIIIQLEGDLRRKDVNIVMGRLRDFEMENKT